MLLICGYLQLEEGLLKVFKAKLFGDELKVLSHKKGIQGP